MWAGKGSESIDNLCLFLSPLCVCVCVCVKYETFHGFWACSLAWVEILISPIASIHLYFFNLRLLLFNALVLHKHWQRHFFFSLLGLFKSTLENTKNQYAESNSLNSINVLNKCFKLSEKWLWCNYNWGTYNYLHLRLYTWEKQTARWLVSVRKSLE